MAINNTHSSENYVCFLEENLMLSTLAYFHCATKFFLNERIHINVTDDTEMSKINTKTLFQKMTPFNTVT